MEQRCIVKDCKNISNEMAFYNGVCAHCYLYLTQGAGTPQAYRNLVQTLLVKLYNYLKREGTEFSAMEEKDQAEQLPPPVIIEAGGITFQEIREEPTKRGVK